MKNFIRRKLASLLLWLAQPFLLEFSFQITKHFAERDRAIESLTAESHEIDAVFVRSIKRLDTRISNLENKKWPEIVEQYLREGRTVSGGCGASQEQKAIGQQQTQLMTQMMGQAQEIFSSSSSVFKDLVNTFAPTVAAGPNQKGFSLPEEAALKSQAITQTGQAYKNASQAVKQANAAVGGGNDALPGGADIGRNIEVANAGAAQTSNELNQIDQANYATGRQNYDFATAGLANAPNVFSVANTAGEVATNSGNAAANTANEISQQNNSWVSAVTGALGGVAGGIVTGGMSNLGAGLGFFGGKKPTSAPSTDAGL